MAVCGVLVVVAVKAILANGFGFQVAPFQMELQIPAGGPEPFQPSPITFGGPSPLMSMMSFPPIFNPMEAMGREEMEGDSRMDVNGPMGNVTTKNKTESKDGFKVTTITSDGPGFHSYIKEYEKEGNSTGNATGPAGPPPDIGKLLSSGKIFDIMNQLRNMGKKPAKCKKCGSGKFCDPIFHLCRKKFAEGRTCMAQKQCGANLRCQWGKCQKAKKGDPGTFCKGNNQCKGDACCRNTPGSFHLMCIPPQTEGAICGLHERQESVAKLFYVVKRSTVATCSPCKSGLKCANTGDSKFKRCVKAAYAAQVDKKKEEEEEEEEEEDNGSGEEENEAGEDEGLPSDSVVDNPLQPQTQAQQQKQLTTNTQQQQPQQLQQQQQQLQQQPQQLQQQKQFAAERNRMPQKKPINGVFEGSVKPPKPETSSARPMGPLNKGQPNQPKDPTGSGDENGSGDDEEEEEEEDDADREEGEGTNNEDGKKIDKKEKSMQAEEEEDENEEDEEEEGSGDNNLPIPTKEEQKQNLQEQKKGASS